MKKPSLTCLCMLTLFSTLSLKAEPNLNADPFDDDPFFQSQNDIMRQMQTLQKTIDQLIQNQFSKINPGVNLYGQEPFGSDTNVEIKETNNELIYKIKLPKNREHKVDVSVKDGYLMLNLNATQKITHTQDTAQSLTYSQSHYNQSFKLPPAYDAKSMHTDIKDSNLIVTFKKLRQDNKISNLKTAL